MTSPVPLLPQRTAATEIATWAQSAQAAPPPLRRLALTLTLTLTLTLALEAMPGFQRTTLEYAQGST